jgi:hypothetical protein
MSIPNGGIMARTEAFMRVEGDKAKSVRLEPIRSRPGAGQGSSVRHLLKEGSRHWSEMAGLDCLGMAEGDDRCRADSASGIRVREAEPVLLSDRNNNLPKGLHVASGCI